MRPLLPLLSLSAALWSGCGPCRETAPTEPPAPSPPTTEDDGSYNPPRDKRPMADRPPPLREDRPLPAGERVALADLPEGEPALVLMIVMDTVRADHTSLCGYERPTTPFLEGLTTKATAWSCRAYSPSPWTLPSHASFFTGAPPTEHGVLAPGVHLDDSYTTLAEHYRAKGYQTLLLSANPTLGVPAPGLTQGFERTVIATRLISPLRGRFARIVSQALDELEPDVPLFLTVNLFDAHDPYPPVPRGLGWVPPQKHVSYHPWNLEPSNPYVQFVTGQMPEGRKQRFQERVINGYDHGISVEDKHVALLFGMLKKRGWLDRPRRIAIVSDHGEYVGERGLLRHGSGTYEPVTRVPLMYLDSQADTPLSLPEPVSAIVVHGLLRDGRLPDPLPPPVAVSTGIPGSVKPSWNTVSAWGPGTDKLTWLEGKTYHFELQVDPDERQATRPPQGHPTRPLLDQRVGAFQTVRDAAFNQTVAPDVQQALEVLGYVEP